MLDHEDSIIQLGDLLLGNPEGMFTKLVGLDRIFLVGKHAGLARAMKRNNQCPKIWRLYGVVFREAWN